MLNLIFTKPRDEDDPFLVELRARFAEAAIRPEEEEELAKMNTGKISKASLSIASSLGMQKKIKRIIARNERTIKPYDKQLIEMNVEEKAKFFKKRAHIMKQMDEATGIPENKRKEMQELGITVEDLKQMPLC